MPYSVGDGAILEVTFEGQHNAQTVMNVWHWYLEDAGTVADAEAFALAFGDWLKGASNIWSNYLDCISQDVIDLQIYLQWILPTRYRYLIANGAPTVGAVGFNAAPQNIQGSLTFFGEEANRHHIGRKSMPGVPANNIAAGKIDVQLQGWYQTLIDSVLADWVGPGGGTLSLVIFNRESPDDSPYVQGGFPQENLRVERRRTVGVGS